MSAEANAAGREGAVDHLRSVLAMSDYFINVGEGDELRDQHGEKVWRGEASFWIKADMEAVFAAEAFLASLDAASGGLFGWNVPIPDRNPFPKLRLWRFWP